MFGERLAQSSDGRHECVGVLLALKMRSHHLDYLQPKRVTAFCVNSRVADYRELVRPWSNQNENGIPVRCLIHFQFLEPFYRDVHRVIRVLPTDENPYFAAGPFFSCSDCSNDFAVIHGIQKVLGIHHENFDFLPSLLPTAACASSAAIPAPS
jgi:hypothetical protein